MVHLVVFILPGYLAKRRIKGRGEPMNIEEFAGNADKIRVEVGHIAGQLLHRIPGRVHRHHDDLGIIGLGALQLADKFVEKGHRRGANIGAVRKPEKYQTPFALQTLPGKSLPVVID